MLLDNNHHQTTTYVECPYVLGIQVCTSGSFICADMQVGMIRGNQENYE